MIQAFTGYIIEKFKLYGISFDRKYEKFKLQLVIFFKSVTIHCFSWKYDFVDTWREWVIPKSVWISLHWTLRLCIMQLKLYNTVKPANTYRNHLGLSNIFLYTGFDLLFLFQSKILVSNLHICVPQGPILQCSLISDSCLLNLWHRWHWNFFDLIIPAWTIKIKIGNNFHFLERWRKYFTLWGHPEIRITSQSSLVGSILIPNSM